MSGNEGPRLQRQLLESMTDAILQHAGLGALLRELVLRLRQTLDSDTAVILLKENGMLVARAAVGFPIEVEYRPRIPVGQGFAGRIAAEGRPVIVEDVDHAEIFNPLLQTNGLKSMLGVPLLAGGDVDGVLHIGFRRSRRFESRDIRVLQRVAERVTPAIENARNREADRRRIASLEALNEVVTALHAAVRIEQVMQTIADTAQRLSGGGQAFAGFFRGRGEPTPTEYRVWEVAGAPRTVFEHLDRLHITPLFAPTFEGRGTVRSDDILTHPLFHGLPEGHIPVRSYLAVPVKLQSGQVLGAILLGHAEPGRFDEETQQHLESLARHAALALEKASLYEREHHVAATLQQALLPAMLPQIPGIVLDAAYRAATPEADVGGDWYDAFPLPDGRIALAVGDVAGHGLDAAVQMGELRHGIRAATLAGHDPATVLHVADTVLRTGGGRMATAVIVIVDPVKLEFTYAAAGHPPPLLATPGGTEMLAQGTVALGFGKGLPIAPKPSPLSPDALLVLYTDGLIEFDRDPMSGEAALRAAVTAEYMGRFGKPAQAILDRVIAGRPTRDDIAILTAAVKSDVKR